MKMDYDFYIWLFVIGSIGGWIIEFVYRRYKHKSFVNPGLLFGPYLPIYGTACLMIGGLSPYVKKSNIFLEFIIFSLTFTSIEAIVGYVSEKLFKKKLWDYTDLVWQWRGIVSMRFSFYWGLIGVIFSYLILPFIAKGFQFYHGGNVWGMIQVLFYIIILEFVLLVVVPGVKNRVSHSRNHRNVSGFLQLARPILKNNRVKSIGLYPHHGGTKRYSHTISVAFISYTLGLRFGLNVKSIVNGALLHDYFDYDWMTDSPGWHGFKHPRIAHDTASSEFRLNKIEKDIILKHMWPLTLVPPFYPESWLVNIIDTYVSSKEYVEHYFSNLESKIN